MTTYINYRCDICKKSFRCQKTAYKIHILNYHSTLKERSEGYTHYCKCCDVGYLSITPWNLHLKTKKHKNYKKVETSNSSHD